MGFRQGAYAKIWQIKNDGKYPRIQISVDRKEKDSDPPVYNKEFSGWATLFGNAQKNVDSISERDTIKINSCDVTTYYDKGREVEYVNYKIFDFELAGNKVTTNNVEKVEPEKTTVEETDNDDALPF